LVHMGNGDELEKTLLTDPQTSGGLLVTCAPDAVRQVLDIFHDEGFGSAAVIGEIHTGTPSLKIM